MRASVLGVVRARLASSGVGIDDADLDASYAIAWQGLYAAVLDGQQIESPAGWLVTACFRRAIDEHRSRQLPGRAVPAVRDAPARLVGHHGDIADALDAKERLLRLFEGISASMSPREREAASLCYLQGLSRTEAAREMGLSPRRMERLMDGRGRGREGVSAKLATVAETIAAGRFCEERASTMRAYALGVLDPDGERHRLALAHQRSCPACRAYVLELRGLAATLPPIGFPGALGLLRAAARSGTPRLRDARLSPHHVARRVASRMRGAAHLARPASAAAGAAGQGASTQIASQGVAYSLGAKLAAAGLASVALGGGVYGLATSPAAHANRRAPSATPRVPAALVSRPPASPSQLSGGRELIAMVAGRRVALRDDWGAAPAGASLLWSEFGFERLATPGRGVRAGAARTHPRSKGSRRGHGSPRRRVRGSRSSAVHPSASSVSRDASGQTTAAGARTTAAGMQTTAAGARTTAAGAQTTAAGAQTTATGDASASRALREFGIE